MGILAELHGKLSSEGANAYERSEDLLISNVFQLLRYVPPEAGLIPVLQQATNLHCRTLDLAADCPQWEVQFWPQYEQCEPDLEIRAYGPWGELAARYFVEAKYLAAKSGDVEFDEEGLYVANSDQLQKEWSVLESVSGGIGCALIYLTAHHVMPRRAIESSVRVTAKPDVARDRFYWLNWQMVGHVLEGLRCQHSGNMSLRTVVYGDIIDLLDKKGLRHFAGWAFQAFENPQRCSLSFFDKWSRPFWRDPGIRIRRLDWRFKCSGSIQ